MQILTIIQVENISPLFFLYFLMGPYTEHRFKKKKSQFYWIPSICQALCSVLSHTFSYLMDLLLSHCREKSEIVPLLCRLLCLESLLLPVCVSLTLVARELSMWRKPFFFHLVQVHGKKLVSFSFLEDERCWFTEKWLDQGGRPNALTAPRAPTWVGTYL